MLYVLLEGGTVSVVLEALKVDKEEVEIASDILHCYKVYVFARVKKDTQGFRLVDAVLRKHFHYRELEAFLGEITIDASELEEQYKNIA